MLPRRTMLTGIASTLTAVPLAARTSNCAASRPGMVLLHDEPDYRAFAFDPPIKYRRLPPRTYGHDDEWIALVETPQTTELCLYGEGHLKLWADGKPVVCKMWPYRG
jgi:hypothetical protein